MAARDLLSAATPGPWIPFGGRYGALSSTDPAAVRLDTDRRGADHVAAYGGALIGESIQAADRELIATMRNEYEALIDITEAARLVRDVARRGMGYGWREFDDALARLDSVRSTA